MRIKRTLANIVLCSMGIISTLGCNFPSYKYENSEIKHCNAVVKLKEYTPESITPDISVDFSDGSVDVDIDVEPEDYKIVFSVEKRQISINGNNNKIKELYKKVNEGDYFDLPYREKICLTFRDLNDDGKKELEKKEVVDIDYDFYDMKPGDINSIKLEEQIQ